MFLKKFIGDRAFYQKLFAIMIPVLIQNVITNFVSLLDNVMVGQVGTEPMSGVAIVNQLFFVFNLCIFGGVAGAGIFTAQFYGKGDHEGVRHTFRMKLYICFGAVALFATVFAIFGETLINQFLHEGEDNLDLAATLMHGKDYLAVMLMQLVPFALMQVYASQLRETGETVLPMKAGIIAVLVNLVLNYVLIFGKCGLPAMGVVGAGIATVISRYVEAAIIMVWTHRHPQRMPFIRGVFRSFHVPKELVKKIAITGTPLILNEVLWSLGNTMLNQCYSVRGLEVVSAINISSTVSNLFFCAFFAMGTTVSVVVGQLLGAGELDRAVDEARKLIAFAVALCAAVGAVMIAFAGLIPELYNTTDTVKALAVSFLTVSGCMIPCHAFCNTAYFTLRSGGKTMITFIFDSGYIWCICVPVALVLSRLTAMPILPMYIVMQGTELFKVILGVAMLKQRKWVNNLVKE